MANLSGHGRKLRRKLYAKKTQKDLKSLQENWNSRSMCEIEN
jgi:hypothetical protein